MQISFTSIKMYKKRTRLKASEPKSVNSDYIEYGVNSLRLGSPIIEY